MLVTIGQLGGVLVALAADDCIIVQDSGVADVDLVVALNGVQEFLGKLDLEGAVPVCSEKGSC